jgi:DNA-binding beta-propeller fold protein YncE
MGSPGAKPGDEHGNRGGSQLIVVNAAAGTVTARVKTGGSPVATAVSADGSSVYVADPRRCQPRLKLVGAAQAWVAAVRFSRAVWVSGWSGPSARSQSASVRSNIACASE